MKIQNKNKSRIIRFKIRLNGVNSDSLTIDKIECKFPHNTLEIFFKECSESHFFDATKVLLDTTGNSSLIDHEVLYIGISTGRINERKSVDRVMDHKKDSKKFISNNQEKHPDKEVLLLLLSFGDEVYVQREFF